MRVKHQEEVEAGALISPSLRLVEPLGAGGMGMVWIADHLTLETQVVVKFISHEHATDATVAARFRREAAAAARVKSPHVVQVLDYDITALGTPFIVMELLHGQDLRTLLQERPILSEREVVAIVRQIGKALSRAHEFGVVHRDIKPENIFLLDHGDDGEPFVKVLDFGIAKATRLDEMTTTGTVVGTPYYMSPEQAVGSKTVDHRTDLWALGVLVFFMLTGRRPFQGATTGAITLALHIGPTPRPTEANPSLPAAIDEWFFKACAREPEARFSSARELVRALGEALLGDSVRPRVPSDAPTDVGVAAQAATLRLRAPAARAAPASKRDEPPTQRERPVVQVATLPGSVQPVSAEESAATEIVASRRSVPPRQTSLSTRVGAALVVVALVAAVAWLGTRRGGAPSTTTPPEAVPSEAAAQSVPTVEPVTAKATATETTTATVPPPTSASVAAVPTVKAVQKTAPPPVVKPTVSTPPMPSVTAKPTPKPPGDDLPDLK